MTQHICKTCGGVLELFEESKLWKCKYCGNSYEDERVVRDMDILREALDEYKIEQVANLRRNLYNAINETYTDSEEICRICERIKEYLPDDFMANFFYTANKGNMKEVSRAIKAINVEAERPMLDIVVSFLTKMLTRDIALPVMDLIERAYKNVSLEKYEKYATAVSEELSRVDRGIYETLIPRDVFVVYSSRDMEKVMELVELLEENNISCFVAARNLRHGRGAVENYQSALREAMDNCKTVVFVSSLASRNMACDALKIELPYIKQKDIESAPFEYKQNYEAMPGKYKKPRVEYRIEQSKSFNVADSVVREFFEGFEYAYSPEEVATRIAKQLANMHNKAFSKGTLSFFDRRSSNVNVPPVQPMQPPMNNVPPVQPVQRPMNNVPPVQPMQRPMNNMPPMQPVQPMQRPVQQPIPGTRPVPTAHIPVNNVPPVQTPIYPVAQPMQNTPPMHQTIPLINGAEEFEKARKKKLKTLRVFTWLQIFLCIAAGVCIAFQTDVLQRLTVSEIMSTFWAGASIVFLAVLLPLIICNRGLVPKAAGKGRIRAFTAKLITYIGFFVWLAVFAVDVFVGVSNGLRDEYIFSMIMMATVVLIYLFNIIAIKKVRPKK